MKTYSISRLAASIAAAVTCMGVASAQQVTGVPGFAERHHDD